MSDAAKVYEKTERALGDAATKVPTDGAELAKAVHDEFLPILQRAAQIIDDDIVTNALLAGLADAETKLKSSLDTTLTSVKNAVEAEEAKVAAAHAEAKSAKSAAL